MPSSYNLEAFFSLLRSGLYGSTLENTDFSQGFDWRVIVSMAKKQGVFSLVYEASRRLPDDIMPPQAIRYEMRKYAIENIRAHAVIDNSVSLLSNFFKSHGIEGVLLKGQGVALYYRDPHLRQCGDIDYYVGKAIYPMASALARQYLFTGDETESVQHLNFSMGNVSVELHRTVGRLYTPIVKRKFQKWIEWELEQSHNRRTVIIGGSLVKLPSYDFDAFYIFYHAWRHYQISGIGLRQLCDWALIFHTQYESIDIPTLVHNIKQFGFISEWKAFACLAVDTLGLDPIRMPLYDPSYSDRSKKILDKIIAGGNFGQYFKKPRVSEGRGFRHKVRIFKSVSLNAKALFHNMPLEAVSYFTTSTIRGLCRCIVSKRIWK